MKIDLHQQKYSYLCNKTLLNIGILIIEVFFPAFLLKETRFRCNHGHNLCIHINCFIFVINANYMTLTTNRLSFRCCECKQYKSQKLMLRHGLHSCHFITMKRSHAKLITTHLPTNKHFQGKIWLAKQKEYRELQVSSMSSMC